MLSIADVGWGSVIGNTLDHGMTYLPYGRGHGGMQCGMEVVLANGDVMRTGMGAMPGNRAWHVYKRGLGPTPDQLFMQSNFGIVTKMGVWLMPYPEVYMPIWVRVWKDDDLGPLVDTLRAADARRHDPDGAADHATRCCSARCSRAASSGTQGDGPIPDESIDRMARELEIGRWMMRFALYGDEAVVDHRFAKIKEAFEQIPGAEVWGAKYAPEEIARTLEHPAERIQGGVPNLDAERDDRLVRRRGGRPHRLLADRAADRPRRVALRDLLRGLIEEAGLDYIAAMLAVNARSFVHVTMIIFDTKNEPQARAAYDVAQASGREDAAKLGLRRVPRAPRLHGPRDRPVLVRRPRVPALQRDDQGRGRPERDPLAGQAGDLAAGDAGRRPGPGVGPDAGLWRLRHYWCDGIAIVPAAS